MYRFLFLLLFFIASHSAFAQNQSKPFKIGVITVLSGDLATIGNAVRNGVELARSEHPELFKEIEFLYEDYRFDGKQAIAAYTSLRNRGVTIFLGFSNVLAYAIAPLVERDHTLLINLNFEAAPVASKQFTIRSFNHTDQYTAALAHYLLKGDTRVFPVVQTESSFFSAMIGGVKKALGTQGTIKEIATVNPGETDFRTILTKLRSYEGSSIGVFLFPDQLIAFLRQAHEAGLHAHYFGTDLCETAASLAPNKKLLEGCVYPDNELSAEFRALYQKRFGDEAQLAFAGNGYDMAMLVGEQLQAAELRSPTDILKRFTTIHEHAGVLGNFSFREESGIGRYFEYPIFVKQIAGGKGVPVK